MAAAAVNALGRYAYNPRGNLWLNDDSTFGHKLLQKMGWQKGKGLGKNENGIKENIKVKVRSSNSGVGWKDNSHANVQTTDYDSLLQSLSVHHSQHPMIPNENNESDVPESRSLVQRSQAFRNRLHYQKFIKGKDISKYSEKDMKSIFILNKAHENEEKPVLENSSSEKKVSDSENKMHEMETYNSQINISDYFAMKMKEKQSNKINRVSNDNPDQQPNFLDSERDENLLASKTTYSGKKRKKTSIVSINRDDISIEEHTEFPLDSEHSNKKRKKSTENSFSNEYVSEIDITCAIQEMHCDKSSISKKKKKKKLSIENVHFTADSKKSEKENNFEVDLTQSYSLNILNPMLSDSMKSNSNNVTCESEELNRDKPASGKKRRKKNVDEDVCTLSESVQMLNKSTNYQKSKKENSFEVDLTRSESLEILEPVLSGNISPVKQQKKAKRKLKCLKKLKSCLKSRSGEYSIRNVSFNETVSYRIIDSDSGSNTGSEIEVVNEIECVTLDAKNTTESRDKDITTAVQEIEISEQNGDSSTNTAVDKVPAKAEPEIGCSLSNLPTSKSSFYNEWIASQRQALKMKIYKSMLKSIKKHEVLRTTNLLSVRGYGNWGY